MFSKKNVLLTAFGFIGLIVLSALLVVFFNKTRSAADEIKIDYLEKMTINVSEFTNDLVESSYEKLALLEASFSRQVNDEEDVMAAINLIQDDLDDGLFIVATPDNKVYGYEKLKLELTGKFRRLVYNINSKLYFLFIKEYNNYSFISKIGYAIPISKLNDSLSIKGFDSVFHTYLLASDFNLLLHYSVDSDHGLEFDNYKSLLKLFEENNLNTEEIKVTIATFSRSIHYVSFIKLNNDWSLMLLVNSSNLGEDYITIINNTNLIFLIYISIVLIGFSVLYFIIFALLNRKRALSTQTAINNQLTIAIDAANKANKAKSEFLSRISHDIRTPMNGIMGMVNLAKKDLDNKDYVAECLNKITITSDHLLSLLNDVLDMSKIETGKIIISEEPLSIIDLINDCSTIVESGIDAENVVFNKSINITNESILGDKLHLRQILINVLGNAVKFTKDGQIDFEVSEEEINDEISKFIFVIKDTGIGMSNEFQKHIYEPFVQEDNQNARTKYMGSGLGMSIVKQLIDKMEGSISLDSELQKGTCFTIEITFRLNKNKPYQLAETTDLSLLKGMHVLLVEDNEINMEIASSMLEAVGIEVVKAYDGIEAIREYVNHDIDYFGAILMDVMMPRLNGLDAARKIRLAKRDDAKTVPIIAMTAKAYKEDEEEAIKSGMNEHVTKPIEFNYVYELLLKYQKNKS